MTSSRSGFDWIPPPPAKVNGISCWCVFHLFHIRRIPRSWQALSFVRNKFEESEVYDGFLMISYVHHISLRSPCRMVQHPILLPQNRTHLTPYAMAAQAPPTGLSHRPRPRCQTSVQISRQAIICWMIFPMFFSHVIPIYIDDFPMIFPIYSWFFPFIDDFPMIFPIYRWFSHDFSHL